MKSAVSGREIFRALQQKTGSAVVFGLMLVGSGLMMPSAQAVAGFILAGLYAAMIVAETRQELEKEKWEKRS